MSSTWSEAVRYYSVSRQVTPEWKTLSVWFKLKHFVQVYRYIGSRPR